MWVTGTDYYGEIVAVNLDKVSFIDVGDSYIRYQDICFDYYDHDALLEAGLDPDFVEGLKKVKQAQLVESADRAKEERRIAYERLKKEFEGT